MAVRKANVLVLGGGAVGAIAAVNLEVGGLAEVTAVLRSNFKAVNEHGYVIESVDHGKLTGWKPTRGTYHGGFLSIAHLLTMPRSCKVSSRYRQGKASTI